MAKEDFENSQEQKEVHEKVLNEVKSLGENIKEQKEEQLKNYSNLKSTFDSGRSETDEKVLKLKEDILTRQEELDKKFAENQKQIENIELALKRPGGIGSGNNVSEIEQKEVVQFFNSVASGRGESVSTQKSREIDYNVDSYREYKNAFNQFLVGVCDPKNAILNPEAAKALSVGVDSDGGYRVPTDMSNKIIERVYELDPIRQLANVETISSDSMEIDVDWDEFSAGWVNETGTRSETDTAKVGKEKIFVHEMYAQPKSTQKFLDDAAVNVESWISRKVARRFARLEGAAFVSGDGSEKPRGFLTYANGTSRGQIEQINMGAAAAITADGFTEIKYSMVEDYLERGTWLMNRTTLKDTMLLKNGVGDYIWKPSMIASDPISTILGSPVRMSTTMPTIAANSLSVVYADWQESYTIVDRLGISIQRDPYTDKPFVLFYTTKRTGGQVVNFQAIKIGKISA